MTTIPPIGPNDPEAKSADIVTGNIEALKVLFYDRTGVCLFYKRLDKGTFRIPAAAEDGATTVQIAERELDDLLDGIDLAAPAARTRTTRH